MELRAGYKQTILGVIPEDWNIDAIENVAEITTGGKNTQDRISDGEYPFFVRSQTVERINSYSFDGEAVLTAGDGVGTGKVFHYINGKFDAHQRVYQISKFNELVSGYFFYLYFSNYFYNRIMQMTAKSSVDSVRREMIAKMVMPLPPIDEQTAIANALSDADALIGSLQKLIAKKRQIKQGAMQTLLNPYENGVLKNGWSFFRLGDLCECQNGTSLERFFNDEDGLKVISIGNYSAFGRFVNTGTYIDRTHFKEVAKYVLQKNDLAMTMNDKTSVGTIIGRVLLIESDNSYVYNQRTMRLRCRESMIPSFAFHLINSDRIHKKMVNLAKPGTQIYVNTDDIVLLELEVPNRANQIRIAAILDSMDDEIAALETKLAKYQQIKQGMMQNLLTGRIRLV